MIDPSNNNDDKDDDDNIIRFMNWLKHQHQFDPSVSYGYSKATSRENQRCIRANQSSTIHTPTTLADFNQKLIKQQHRADPDPASTVQPLIAIPHSLLI